MAKLLVKDFRTLSSYIKEETKATVGDLDIVIKKYLTIAEKIEMCSSIYNVMLEKEDDYFVYNENLRRISTVYYIVDYYTNLTLPKDAFETYDILKSSGLSDVVINAIGDREVEEIESIINNFVHIEQEKDNQKNSMAKTIKNVLNGFVGFLENLSIEDIKKEFQKQTKGD